MSDGRYCHERDEEHDYDDGRHRVNAMRHCLKCPMRSLDYDEDDEEIDA